MDEKRLGRSGEFVNENGENEFWWDGINYHSIIPEEMIDEVLAASEKKDKFIR